MPPRYPSGQPSGRLSPIADSGPHHSAWAARLCAAGAAVAATLSLGTASAHAQSYNSPGYAGTKSFQNDVPPPLAPITLGTGKYPTLLVDGAGTAHVVYAQDGGASAPDSLAYCNLPRGLASCASAGQAPNPQPPDPSTPGGAFSGNIPAGNHDFAGPFPLDIGNQLFIVDRRFPDAFNTPGGGTSESNVFEWNSDNGGATITGPGLIGDNQAGGGAVVFGDPSTPSIGTISRTQTEGTFFQASQTGQYTTDKAQLGSSAQAYSGELALDPASGTPEPVAVLADANTTVFVREFSGRGTPNDAANWSQASFPGSDPQIVGGSAGVFVLFKNTSTAQFLLRRIVGGQPSGTLISLGPSLAVPSISEDPTGRISFAYTDSLGVEVRTSSDGVSFSPPELAASIPDGGSVGHLVTAATADGGGFVSYVRNPVGAEGIGTVVAAAFGSQRATSIPGLGSVPGGGLGSATGDQLATSTCQSAKFGAVDAEITAGCYGHDPKDVNLDVTLGELDLNGLIIKPDPGVRIGVDPRQHTIDTTGPVAVLLRAKGFPDITLFHGELHVKVPSAGIGADLLDLHELSAPIIAGFPIDGDVDVKLTGGGVDIPVSLKLPGAFGGITGSATLHATTAGGLSLASLHFTVGDANLGALELKDVDVSYTEQGNVWKGMATLLVPAGGSALKASVTVEFDNGQFKSGSLDLGLPYPGIPLDDVDTPPELYLSHGGLGLGLNPITLTGTVGLGLTPVPPVTGGGDARDYAFSLDGSLSVAFGNPVTITATATGYLYKVQLAQATLVYKLPDQVSLTGTAKLDLGIVSFNGQVGAIFDPKHHVYGGRIHTDVTIQTPGPIPTIKLTGVSLAFNNRGFGVYNPSPPFIGTLTYNWGDDLPHLIVGSDVTSRFTAGIPGANADRRSSGDGTRARAAAATGFTVPRGAPSASLIVHGTGGAPALTLISPSGRPITPAARFGGGATVVAIPDTAAGVTDVGLLHPAAGRWTVSSAAGSAAGISSLQYAIGERPPRLSATVSGRDFSRAVRYRATIPDNVTVRLVEQTGRLLHVIGALHSGRGTIRFRPAYASPGRRQLVAQIINNGVPISEQVLSSFSVPKPPRPARSRGLRVAAGFRTFTYTYRPPAGAVRVILRITATDGRHLERIVSPSVHAGSLPVIGFRDGVTVTVRGVGADGSAGPAVSAGARRKK